MPARPTVALTEAARTVLEARYLGRAPDGRIDESPDQLFDRVASAVAKAEAAWGGEGAVRHWQRVFAQRMGRLEFLPNSPTLMNAGTRVGQLSACFVLPIEDSLEGIFRALTDVAAIQRTGGGTGFSFSTVRAAGAPVEATHGIAAGPVAFIRLFDAATELLRHGGRRRGANMAVLAVTHPDIQAFIDAKRSGALRNFNLSVGVTDAFLKAVEADGEHALVDPATGQAVARVPARGLFEKIVEAAWATGDPGLVFLDTIARGDPLAIEPPIVATNPCGEVPLRPNEACTLGSLNLSRFMREGRMDEIALAQAARDAIRFLDDVVEVNVLPTPAIAEAVRATRKVGLGVMGFADALLQAGVAYGSPESVALAGAWMQVVRAAADDASRALAEERGPFPLWEHARQGPPMRNATRTSVAPTGTIAIVAGTSPGIEPLFALSFERRNVLDGKTLHELNPVFEERMRQRGAAGSALVEAARATGRLPADADPALHRLFVTALDVPPAAQLAIQAAFQRHVDNAVSKTINLPTEATTDDVRDAYLGAWRLGLKGITVYRYGSKTEQVMVLGTGQATHGPVRCGTADCQV